jgi:Flp pilus assembly protein TadB
MEETDELRALKREINMSRERKEEKNIWVKNRKKKKRTKKEEKERKRMNQMNDKKSARKDDTLLRDETSTIFPTMCNPTTRTSSVPRSLIFFFLCTCLPFYIFLSLISPHIV